MEEKKIDYVIPFVNMNDEIWQAEREKYSTDDVAISNTSNRFRDWDTLKYQLRSIEKFLPWINNIYIVLSIGKSQIPEWLNTRNKRIKIVYDYQIVPKEILPVFNSNVIDLYIPRIKGLSEYYLYACDDYIVTKYCIPEDFFYKGKIRIKINLYKWEEGLYSKTVINSGLFMSPHLIKGEGEEVIAPYCDHSIVPHIKSENLKLLKEYNDVIQSTLTRFRDGCNLTWLIYTLNLYNKDMRINGKLVAKVIKMFNEDNIKEFNFDDCDFVVLNDFFLEEDFKDAKALLVDKLQQFLPDKSQFEKKK